MSHRGASGVALTAIMLAGGCSSVAQPSATSGSIAVPVPAPSTSAGNVASTAGTSTPLAPTTIADRQQAIIEIELGPAPELPAVDPQPVSVDGLVPINPAWSATVETGFVGVAAATDELVAVTLPTEGFVVALDRVTGAELWRYDVGRTDANISVSGGPERVLVTLVEPPNVRTAVELDRDGREVSRFEVDDGPIPFVDSSGNYVVTATTNAITTFTAIDPLTGEVRDEWTAVATGAGWGTFPFVATDGSVVLMNEVTRERVPTPIVLDLNVQAMALVDQHLLTYLHDEIALYRLDGTQLWSADYDGDTLATQLHPVGGDSSLVAITTQSRVDVLDISRGQLVWGTDMAGAQSPFRLGERLLARVQPSADSVGLLDFATGTVQPAIREVGFLGFDEESMWLDQIVPSAAGRIVGLASDGTPQWLLQLPEGARREPVRGGVVRIETLDGSTTVQMYEYP